MKQFQLGNSTRLVQELDTPKGFRRHQSMLLKRYCSHKTLSKFKLTNSRLTASADKTFIQNESLAKSCHSQTFLTLLVWHNGELDSFKNRLIFTLMPEHILSPTGHKASMRIKVCARRWQAYWSHMLPELRWRFEEEKRDVVAQSFVVKVLVHSDILNLVVAMRENFVFRLSVPLASSYYQSFGFFVVDEVGG